MAENVILVDHHDNQIGQEEKIKAHKDGKLHRAFSIFVFNSRQDMLIHQRAFNKYHTGGLWTNTCCSHPRPGEETEEAAHRRLQEEMGFDCPLEKAFSFIYKVRFEEDDLTEHEFDHVFIGYSDAIPNPNPEEVATFTWVPIYQLEADIAEHPENYTYWFKIAFPKVIEYLNKKAT